MIEGISLKFTDGKSPLSIPTKGVTIFVGPNNSGKSLILKELEAAFSSPNEVPSKLLNDFEIEWLTAERLAIDIDALTKKAPPTIGADQLYIDKFNASGQLEGHAISRQHVVEFFKNKTNKKWLASQFIRYFLIRLDGRTRFDLTNDRPRGDILGPPQNYLAHFFKDETLRKELRDIVFDAFGVYFTIDALSETNYRIRLSPTKPDEDEQNLNTKSRAFHAAATHIKEASDGMQAFVGILCAVFSGDYRMLLIDEPEAFLHPPLAKKLGQQLTALLTKKGGSLLASTHSPDFLMGCLQASLPVRVVRLEYSN